MSNSVTLEYGIPLLKLRGSADEAGMIPAIGYMIGAYILLRCFDVFASPEARFADAGSRRAMKLAAVVVIGVTLYGILGIATNEAMIPGLAR